MSRRLGVWRLTGLMVAGSLVAGCGLFGGSGDTGVGTGEAGGFTRASPARISFAYPDDWKKADKTARGWVLMVSTFRDPWRR